MQSAPPTTRRGEPDRQKRIRSTHLIESVNIFGERASRSGREGGPSKLAVYGIVLEYGTAFEHLAVLLAEEMNQRDVSDTQQEDEHPGRNRQSRE